VEEINDNGVSHQLFFNYADKFENPKKITHVQVRNVEKFKNLSDNSVQQIIDELYQLSVLTYRMFKVEE